MKTEILRILKESPGRKFKSKEIAKILWISVTESSRHLLSLCNSYQIHFSRDGNFKVFYIPLPTKKENTTQSRVVPEFKPMKGYTAKMSERLERKDFHLITLDEH